ncbi:MAG TPA: hypothetical protein VLJ39_13605 [Tepidisphaeraceae bacterium]|nr:hypothetical protein [Tepidisphaeraceae bacterium]
MAKRQKDRNEQKQAQASHPRLKDFENVGPVSIEGVEASDLPDKGRGDVFTNPSKEAGRKLPQQTGQYGDGADTGLRGDPDVADAQEHGGRKKN